MVSGTCIESVKNKIEKALDKVDSLSASKSECCVFTKKMDERKWNPRLNIGEKKINVKKSMIFLDYMPGNGIWRESSESV